MNETIFPRAALPTGTPGVGLMAMAPGGADRRLLRFEGLSNLRDDAGLRPLKVRIEFPQAPRPAEPGAWERLAAEPLKPCRVQG